MNALPVLDESDVEREPALLDRAWSEGPTFALKPHKSALDRGQLEHALGLLPAALREGHFGILTSGSTGLPKLIIGARDRAGLLARRIHAAQADEVCTQAIVALPLSYSYAFVNQWVWSHVFERELVLTRGFAEPERLHAALTQARGAMLCLVGGQVPLLELLGDASFSGVVRLHFAGGRFPQERLPALRARFPNARIFNNYGCAEAMPRLCVREAEDGLEAGEIGLPLPGVELRADEGRLEFRSETGAAGFVDAEGFHPIAREDWVPTGDLGEQGARGFRLLGRAGDVFKRYGEKVSLPLLLQTVQAAWPHAAAFYRQPDKSGEEGCVLVLSPRPAEPEVRALLRELRAHHARPQWPLRVESVEALPLLANGKIDARALAGAAGRVVHWDQRL